MSPLLRAPDTPIPASFLGTPPPPSPLSPAPLRCLSVWSPIRAFYTQALSPPQGSKLPGDRSYPVPTAVSPVVEASTLPPLLQQGEEEGVREKGEKDIEGGGGQASSKREGKGRSLEKPVMSVLWIKVHEPSPAFGVDGLLGKVRRPHKEPCPLSSGPVAAGTTGSHVPGLDLPSLSSQSRSPRSPAPPGNLPLRRCSWVPSSRRGPGRNTAKPGSMARKESTRQMLPLSCCLD